MPGGSFRRWTVQVTLYIRDTTVVMVILFSHMDGEERTERVMWWQRFGNNNY
jgi:hypothetical protein